MALSILLNTVENRLVFLETKYCWRQIPSLTASLLWVFTLLRASPSVEDFSWKDLVEEIQIGARE